MDSLLMVMPLPQIHIGCFQIAVVIIFAGPKNQNGIILMYSKLEGLMVGLENLGLVSTLQELLAIQVLQKMPC